MEYVIGSLDTIQFICHNHVVNKAQCGAMLDNMNVRSRLTLTSVAVMPHFPESLARISPTIAQPSNAAAREILHEPDEARAARIRVKTRRRRYLELHPEYFDSENLELAGQTQLPR